VHFKCWLPCFPLWCAFLGCTESYSINQAMTMQCSMCWTGLVALPLPLCLRALPQNIACLVSPQVLKQAARHPLTSCSCNSCDWAPQQRAAGCKSDVPLYVKGYILNCCWHHMCCRMWKLRTQVSRVKFGSGAVAVTVLVAAVQRFGCKFQRWWCPTAPDAIQVEHCHYRCRLCLPCASRCRMCCHC
jgi:hypothetical protein